MEQLDLSEMERAYKGAGSAPFHPALLLSILTYGSTGVFSSRKLEAIGQARAKIEERARERFEQASAAYQDKVESARLVPWTAASHQ